MVLPALLLVLGLGAGFRHIKSVLSCTSVAGPEGVFRGQGHLSEPAEMPHDQSGF